MGDALPGNAGVTAGHFRPAAPGRLLSVPREDLHQNALSLGRGDGGTPPVHSLFCHCITFGERCQGVRRGNRDIGGSDIEGGSSGSFLRHSDQGKRRVGGTQTAIFNRSGAAGIHRTSERYLPGRAFRPPGQAVPFSASHRMELQMISAPGEDVPASPPPAGGGDFSALRRYRAIPLGRLRSGGRDMRP